MTPNQDVNTLVYCLKKSALSSSASASITKSKYIEIQTSKKGLFRCITIEENFDILIENYLEFETTLLEISTRNMVSQGHEHLDYQLVRNKIDRRIVNLLSACRAYIDSTKKNVLQILSQEACDISDVKALFTKQYDDRFGYRCMEALRIHTQHRGAPIHTFTLESKWVEHDDNKSLLLFAVSPYIKPDHLREAGGFKSSVLQEMEAKSQKIDIKALVRDYVEGLAEIHLDIRQQLTPLVNQWDRVIRDTIEEFDREYPKESTTTLAAVVQFHDGTEKEMCQIFSDIIDHRKYFEKKNDRFTNLAKRFVTSEVIENSI